MSNVPNTVVQSGSFGQPNWQQRRSSRRVMAFGASIVYSLVFVVLFPLLGNGTAALAIIPVVILGWLGGFWMGLLAGLLSFPLNTVLLNLAGAQPGGWDIILRSGSGAGTAALVLVGAFVGRLRDLAEAAQRERLAAQQSLQALQTRERRYRTLFEHSSPLALLGSDGTILDESPALSKLLGYAAHKWVGQNVLQKVHPDDVANATQSLATLLAQPGTPVVTRVRYQHQDGSWRWLEGISTNLLGEPTVQAIIVVYQDISAQKRAEQALQRRAGELATLYDTTLDVSVQQDLPALLQTVVEHAATLLESSSASIYLYDTRRRDLQLAVAYGPPSQLGTRLALGQGLCGRVAQTSMPVIVNPDDHWEERSLLKESIEQRAFLGVPMIHSGELRGVLSVGAVQQDTRKYSDADAHLLSLFATQAATAMENARLFRETRQRLAELEAVNKISTALRAAQTLDTMLPLLLDETLALVQTSTGSIWLYAAEPDELQQVVARGWFAQQPRVRKPGEGLSGMAFVTGQPHVSREFRTDARVAETSRAMNPESWGGALLPIRAAEAIIGVLALAVQLPRELTDADTHLLTTIAEIAGIAIQRSRLHEQTLSQLRHVAALHQIGVAISASLDLDSTLHRLIDEVIAQLDVDACDVLLLNPHSHTLEYAAGRGFRTQAIEHTHVRLGEGQSGRAALERRMVTVPDLSQAEIHFSRAALLAGEGFVSHSVAPLVAKGELKGLLEIFSRSRLDTRSERLHVLAALATQAAIAIDNASLFADLQQSNQALAVAYDETIEGWSRALDLRDQDTEGHTQRVTELTLRLARAVGLPADELVHIRRGALLHDIGKMAIPDGILLKPGPLTEDEWAVMRKHPVHAYELLLPIQFLRLALDIPYCHHEKWDGSGYPRGLRGEQIPPAARVFAVADVWDALRSNRPYRPGWPDDKVHAYLREQAGTHFEPQAVASMLKLLDVLT